MLLSYGLWRDRFGSSPGHRGQDGSGKRRRSGRSSGSCREVFAFPIREAAVDPAVSRSARASREDRVPNTLVIARLKPDVTVAQARAQARTIAAQLESEFPADQPRHRRAT